ncbi:MAG: hypothetical protein AAFR03_12750 [Pseudomonadota bacterium]
MINSTSTLPSIAFATCRAQPDFQPSDAIVAEALKARGIAVRPVAWNGDQAAFDSADLIVVRSTWDYYADREGFAAWLAGLRQRDNVFNAPALMGWNYSKRYLARLREQGAPLPPTVFCAPTKADIASAMDALNVEEAVVKPVIGAGGIGLTRVKSGSDADFRRAAEALKGSAAIVQPVLHEITTLGETSFVFIDGRFSHAVRKRPVGGRLLCQEEHGGTSSLVVPSNETIADASKVLDMVPTALPDGTKIGKPLYARIDAIVSDPQIDESAVERLDAAFQLMEVELIEPELFFNLAPAAAEHFAEAIIHRLK